MLSSCPVTHSAPGMQRIPDTRCLQALEQCTLSTLLKVCHARLKARAASLCYFCVICVSFHDSLTSLSLQLMQLVANKCATSATSFYTRYTRVCMAISLISWPCRRPGVPFIDLAIVCSAQAVLCYSIWLLETRSCRLLDS